VPSDFSPSLLFAPVANLFWRAAFCRAKKYVAYEINHLHAHASIRSHSQVAWRLPRVSSPRPGRHWCGRLAPRQACTRITNLRQASPGCHRTHTEAAGHQHGPARRGRPWSKQRTSSPAGLRMNPCWSRISPISRQRTGDHRRQDEVLRCMC
jgi:hypothetical protein